MNRNKDIRVDNAKCKVALFYTNNGVKFDNVCHLSKEGKSLNEVHKGIHDGIEMRGNCRKKIIHPKDYNTQSKISRKIPKIGS